MRDQQGNEPPTVGEIKDAVFATSRKLTPEQEIIAGFRGMLKEEFTALIQKLRESANAIEDPGVRAQVERRVSALIEDINDARRRADARFGADTRKFSSRGEAFLKGRYGTIQREKEPLMARAKTAMTQVNDLEKALQGQDSALAIRLESCGQQSQTIQTIMQEIEQYASAIEKAMQEKNTGQLPSAIAALEKTFFLLKKELGELEKTLDDFFSDTQNPREKTLNAERQELDERIKTLILEITHFKEEEFHDIGESVTKQRTPDRTNLYHELKEKVRDLEKRIEPLEELTAHSLNDATTHDIERLGDDNKNRTAFLEETQILFDEAMRLYTRLAESFRLTEEIPLRRTQSGPNQQIIEKDTKREIHTWWDRMRKFFE